MHPSTVGGRSHFRLTDAGRQYLANFGEKRTTPSGHRVELRSETRNGELIYKPVYIYPDGQERSGRSYYAKDKRKAQEAVDAANAREGVTPAKKAAPAKKATKRTAEVQERMRRALPAVREAAQEAAADEQELRMRARGALLDRDIRDLEQPGLVEAEMQRLREQDRIDAARLQAAGTRVRVDEKEELLRDPEGDNSIMHGDSAAMELAQALAARNRNGSANKVMRLRHSYSNTRDNPDIDATQRAIDELRLMRAEESDPEIRRLYDKALAQMDAPATDLPDIPASTPLGMRQLLEDLNRIPLARRVESGNLPEGGRISAVEQLAEIFRQIDASDVRDPAGLIGRVLHRYHESRDGAYPMWNLERRLDPGTPLTRELREWARRDRGITASVLVRPVLITRQKAGRVLVLPDRT
jgi:hypothetical protein